MCDSLAAEGPVRRPTTLRRLAAAGAAAACLAGIPALGAPPPAAAAATAPAAVPAAGGFDPAALDRGTAPCDDFYEFACGGWIASHAIPPDQPATDRWRQVEARTAERLRAILEDAAAGRPAAAPRQQPPPAAAPGPATPQGAREQPKEPLWLAVRKNQAWVAEPQAPPPPPPPAAPMSAGERRKLGDDYESCMDEAGIEARGTAPLAPELRELAALRSTAELPEVVARLHLAGVGALFQLSTTTDPQRGETTIAVLDAGGTALPERDLYLRDDAAAAAARRQYASHIERMLALAGEPPVRAAAEAADALAIETALARATLDAAGRRNPERLEHVLDRPALKALTPAFDWNSYFGTLGAPPMESLVVAEPDFLRAMDATIAGSGVVRLQSYLRWQLVHAAAPLLPGAFAAEDFAWFQQTLLGISQPPPRWRRCVASTAADLGESLGRAYVEQTFEPAARQRIAALFDSVQLAFATDISTRTWLSEPTKRRALVKLRDARAKIAGPSAWHDDAGLDVVRGDALGNRQRAAAFQLRRLVAHISMPPERDEWQLSAAAVDARYDPLRNDVTLPAGLLQPPFFDPQADDAALYGAIGTLIGRELAHGFDDVGRYYDADGTLRGGWAPADLAEFDRRAACVADQYAAYPAFPGEQVNARLTLGDDLADGAGLRVAFLAFRSRQQDHSGAPATAAGFDADQRFFLAFAQNYCGAAGAQQERLLAATATHAPDRVRVVGALADSPEFARAFSCPAGAPMVRRNACRLW